MAPTNQLFWFLLNPWLLMIETLYQLPPTILQLFHNHTLHAAILHPSRLQSAWFGNVWTTLGPGIRNMAEPRVVPLLEGSVANGQVVAAMGESGQDDGHGQQQQRGLRGTVLEVGPGTGLWVPLFAKLHLSGRGITRVYGVEPHPDVHAALRQNIAAAGMDDIYEIVPVGIEDLAASGRVARESVDCIVSIMCLCGIPDPEFNIREIYGYLKPGGTWYVYEHVKCGSERMRESGLFMRAYQRESTCPVYASFLILTPPAFGVGEDFLYLRCLLRSMAYL